MESVLIGSHKTPYGVAVSVGVREGVGVPVTDNVGVGEDVMVGVGDKVAVGVAMPMIVYTRSTTSP